LPVDHSNITTDILQNNLLVSKQVTVNVLRLDKIHPVISGNKLFKLHYFLDQPAGETIKPIITFGGAFSNHLVATAYACKINNFRSIGIIRGEKPTQLSHTLNDCMNYGMELRFISRKEYDRKDDPDFIKALNKEFGDSIIIPEGGFHPLGANGASLIMPLVKNTSTHVCCAVGTATTLAGLLLKKKEHQQIIAIPVLKGMIDIRERVEYLTGQKFNTEQLHIEYEYHFGGYAKKSTELIDFMNDVYGNFLLPTDFVYTAKMLYAIFDMIKKDFFAKGSKVVCIHTGGLQGNLSLPKAALTF
jgi:1-aminocyclopropane-1-carboxylate deaminase/D-cysteine desulfhydrase-like pyridoxal-dependent ACC family enzyme